MRLPQGSRKSRNGPGNGWIPASANALRTPPCRRRLVQSGDPGPRVGCGLFAKREIDRPDQLRPVAAPASKFEIEQPAIEGQSLFDVADLKHHMVEAYRTRFSVFGHGALQHFALNRGKPLLLLRGSVVLS